jgi:hypothetical protein
MWRAGYVVVDVDVVDDAIDVVVDDAIDAIVDAVDDAVVDAVVVEEG